MERGKFNCHKWQVMKMSESATGNYMTCKDIVNKAHVRVGKKRYI